MWHETKRHIHQSWEVLFIPPHHIREINEILESKDPWYEKR